MAVIQDGSGTTNVMTVEPNMKSARVSQRPQDIGSLGAYAFSTDNGGTVMTAGLAAAAEIYQFRWTHATNLCLLRSIKFSMGSVVAFVAGRMVFEAVKATAWTVAGTGGATATITGNKKRTSQAATTLGEIRTATTAALTAGTKTLETNGFGNIAGGAPPTVGMIIGPPVTYIWSRDTGDEWPFVFAQNEGFIVRATVPGTGTWNFGITVEYAEVTSF